MKVFPDADIKTFTDPNIGLRHIHTTYNRSEANDVFVLLDINMPTLMGWAVLDEVITLQEVLKKHLKIFMLTSSVDPKDKERAGNNTILWGYIEKPLTDVKIRKVLFEED